METGKSKSEEWEGMETTDAKTNSWFQPDRSSDSLSPYSLHDAGSRVINRLLRYLLHA